MTHEEYKNNLIDIEKPLIKEYEKILKDTNPVCVLEVGSGWGLFSRACMEYSDAKLITIDKGTYHDLKQYTERTKGFESRIKKITADSHEYLKELIKDIAFFDFIFVDGDHTEPGAKQDIKECWQLLDNGGTMMIDDCFHKCNWDKLDTGEFNFGVTIAVWSFLQAHRDEIKSVEIRPVAHGLILIHKK
jgi:predicted O-methyltransferase YrrM